MEERVRTLSKLLEIDALLGDLTGNLRNILESGRGFEADSCLVSAVRELESALEAIDWGEVYLMDEILANQ